MNQEHADAAWVVSVHDAEADARVTETLLSLRYALPTLPFVARPIAGAEARSVVGDQDAARPDLRRARHGDRCGAASSRTRA